ncbi:hypothetical protein LguiA_009798 [Lonicera macranthoides]
MSLLDLNSSLLQILQEKAKTRTGTLSSYGRTSSSPPPSPTSSSSPPSNDKTVLSTTTDIAAKLSANNDTFSNYERPARQPPPGPPGSTPIRPARSENSVIVLHPQPYVASA